MKSLLILVCLFAFFLTGCLRHEYKKAIVNGYTLYAYETNQDMTLTYFNKYGGIEIIPPTVFSIGYNKNFIIAKQHPTIYPANENKNITNYFIVPIKQPVKWTDNNLAIGPLTEDVFWKWRKKLTIPDTLTFTITYNDIK